MRNAAQLCFSIKIFPLIRGTSLYFASRRFALYTEKLPLLLLSFAALGVA